VKVLMVASEGHPFIKTGGLADVIGSLPAALKNNNVDVRVVLPKYMDIPDFFTSQMERMAEFEVDLAWRKQYCGIEKMIYQGIIFYFVDNEYYFKRHGLYGFFDEAERFGYFSLAVLAMLPWIDFKPDIIHLHDWQASLVPVFLKTKFNCNPFYQHIKTVLTIHNLKYQGVFSKDVLGDVLGLDDVLYDEKKMEFFGAINYLKGGIAYADLISTVSKTYAEEIKSSYFGENLDGILRQKDDIRGIINGIDQKVFNPRTDPHLIYHYQNRYETKVKNKEYMQAKLGLPVGRDIPMIAFISRLVEQKGLDLILRVLPDLMAKDLQLVILGTGDSVYEQSLKDWSKSHEHQFSINLMYSESFAHQLYAASDMMLLPSKFEPCGLTQLIALRYGSIPIVRETGGLKDTVIPYHPGLGTGSGFTFFRYNAHDMLNAIERALDLYQDKARWSSLVCHAMNQDFGWDHSAHEYVAMYQELLGI